MKPQDLLALLGSLPQQIQSIPNLMQEHNRPANQISFGKPPLLNTNQTQPMMGGKRFEDLSPEEQGSWIGAFPYEETQKRTPPIDYMWIPNQGPGGGFIIVPKEGG